VTIQEQLTQIHEDAQKIDDAQLILFYVDDKSDDALIAVKADGKVLVGFMVQVIQRLKLPVNDLLVALAVSMADDILVGEKPDALDAVVVTETEQ
jgi:hypothetical protein